MLVAGSAFAMESRIAFGDLDLSTRRGAEVFDTRVGHAAGSLCHGYVGLRRTDCRQAVRDEAMEKLPRSAQADYARARRAYEA